MPHPVGGKAEPGVEAERTGSRAVGPAAVAAELLLGLLLLLAYSYFRQPPGPNELTRLFSIQAFIDHGTLNIDRYAFQTPDKAYYAGHYYSDKAPGTFLLGAPLYWTAERVMWLFGVPLSRDLALGVLQVALSGFPSAALGVGLARMLRDLGLPHRRAIDFAALYGLGTIAFSFATVFFGHQLAAALAFGACALLVNGPTPRRPARVALAGTLCSLAVITEYSAAIVWLALLAYVTRRERHSWCCFCLGSLPSASALAIYNLVLFDSPFRLGYAYVDNPDFAKMHAGLLGLTHPTLHRAVDVLVSGRGLLFWSPFLVFALRGYRQLSRVSGRPSEAKLLAAVGLAYFVFDASYYAPTGHWSIGPRFMLPALPYLVALSAFGVSESAAVERHLTGDQPDGRQTVRERQGATAATPRLLPFVAGLSMVPVGVAQSSRRHLFRVMACWSIVMVFLGTAIDPKPPGHFVFPLVDYHLPRLTSGDTASNLATLVLGISPTLGAAVLALILALGWPIIRRLTPDPGRP